MTFNELKVLLEAYKYIPEIVPVEKAKSMQQGLEKLLVEEELHEDQVYYINEAISRTNSIPSKWSTVMIVAVPLGGLLLVEKRKHIKEIVKEAGFAITDRQNLPLKRLAVQSGLAKYGRNNLTYVNGLGSRLNLTAFLTNIPCENSIWREMPVAAPMCDNCELCIESCPRGAIRKDRFLLDRSKCKLRCLICQDCCPMNQHIGG